GETVIYRELELLQQRTSKSIRNVLRTRLDQPYIRAAKRPLTQLLNFVRHRTVAKVLDVDVRSGAIDPIHGAGRDAFEHAEPARLRAGVDVGCCLSPVLGLDAGYGARSLKVLAQIVPADEYK